MAVKYKYVGTIAPDDPDKRDYLPGIPARDLTDEDIAALTPEQRADVEAATIYESAGGKTKPVSEGE